MLPSMGHGKALAPVGFWADHLEAHERDQMRAKAHEFSERTGARWMEGTQDVRYQRFRAFKEWLSANVQTWWLYPAEECYNA